VAADVELGIQGLLVFGVLYGVNRRVLSLGWLHGKKLLMQG
jgi:hypothetical protein